MRKVFASLRARVLVLIAIPFALVLGLTVYNSLVESDGPFTLMSRLVELGLIAMTFGAVWLGSESLFVRRIAALTAAAEKLGKGNLAARVEIEASGDEIGQLAQSFDRMAKELQATDAERSRVVRALRVLSAANRALAHARQGEGPLLDGMTRAMGEAGGYRQVWVGYAEDNPERSIRTVARWGSLTELDFDDAKLSWGEAENGQTPPGMAIRTGMPVVVKDIQREPGAPPWRTYALRSGCGACVALPLRIEDRVIGVLNIGAYEIDAFSAEEVKLLVEAAADLAFGIAIERTKAERDRVAHAHKNYQEKMRTSLAGSVRAIADTVEMRDPHRAGHQRRIVELTVAIARELGVAEDEIYGIGLAASIHDLGTIQVPAEILAKPGKLTDAEIALVKTHARTGHDILKDIEYPWPIAQFVLQHHERFDGAGYPQGLKGDQILLGARIIGVADVLAAMVSPRPHRPAAGIDAALAEIERGRGTAFDPSVVDACLALFREGRFALQT